MRLLWLLALAATAAQAANLAPEFQAWKENRKDSAFRRDLDGKPALGVRGDGTNSVVWNSTDLKLRPGGAYVFRFNTRAQGSGTIVSGVDGVNRDFSASGDWSTYSFAFRAPDAQHEGNAPPATLHLGHWNLKGEAFFQDVELFTAQLADCSWGALSLGEGERLEPGAYVDTHTLQWRGSTVHRTLLRQNAGFNSNRWTFSSGAEIVYKHDLPFAMNGGEVRINVNYHTGGLIVVSTSKDGQNWTRVAETEKVGEIRKTLPPELFPAKDIFVRLQAEGSKANLQVDAYTFRAQCDYDKEPRIGRTTILEERVSGLGIRASAEEVHADAQLEGKAGWHVCCNNDTATERKLDLKVSVGAQALHKTVSLPANAETGLTLPFPPMSFGANPGRLRVMENGQPVYEARSELNCTVLAESNYGYALASVSPNLALWWCEGAWKVGMERALPSGPLSSAIAVEAARGEFEAAQLVLRANGQVVLLQADISDLNGPGGKIPSSQATLFEVATVRVEHVSDNLGEPGDFPDPLPPLKTPLELPSRRNQALWLLIHVPDHAAPGDYKGVLRLRTSAGENSIPIALHVYAFALPKKTTLRSGFGLDASAIKRYHHLKTREHEEQVWELYMRSFAQHRIFPYNFWPHAQIQVNFKGEGAAKQVLLDTTTFDLTAKKYLDEWGFNAFMLQLQGMGGGTFFERHAGEFGGFKAGTAEYERLFGDYVRQVEAHLRNKGWLNKAYVYWFDEPEPRDYPFVIDGMARLKRHAPGLRRLLTEQPEPALLGHVDLWCGLTPEWSPKTVAERRAAGEEVWWYICCVPHAPFIGEFLEHPAVEMRLWPWQSWQYGVQGLLIWQTNYWSSHTAFPKSMQNPWKDPMSYVSGYGVPEGTKQFWGNGDGRYLYPPRREPNTPQVPAIEGPVSSLRWENLRDGVEDYEYFVLLQSEINRVQGKADAALLSEAKTLLVVPENVSKNTTHFSVDVRPLLVQRRKLAEMIEKLIRLQ